MPSLRKTGLGMMVHTYNPSTWGTEVREMCWDFEASSGFRELVSKIKRLWFWDSLNLYSSCWPETLSSVLSGFMVLGPYATRPRHEGTIKTWNCTRQGSGCRGYSEGRREEMIINAKDMELVPPQIVQSVLLTLTCWISRTSIIF